ncbi:hypothetical protein EVAR_87773_1 [Eumeta japonica]|uniref:Uncharacterized protein n=1 Tax=Eumeta variegata TaxID=151549 RepID=A0A4C1X378_EUMVA|nr:hypothetical protein EVAR_87773_1 [Eumeta japonica]
MILKQSDSRSMDFCSAQRSVHENEARSSSSSSSSSLNLQPVAMTERDKSRYTEGSVNIGGSVGSSLEPAGQGIYSSTVSRAMMSSASTPSLKSVPFFVGEFHRARKPAPLNRFLVHSQSSYDEQRQYAKSQVCAVLRRRVPPCTKISAAEPFSRPRDLGRSKGLHIGQRVGVSDPPKKRVQKLVRCPIAFYERLVDLVAQN